MPNFVLFETTESVIEILWDIALAFFIVRLGFIYFLVTFASGTLLSYLAYKQWMPVMHLTTPQSELALIPFMLVLSSLWARYTIVHYEIPRVRAFRLAIGGMGLAFMVAAEFVTACVLYEEGHGDWLFETDLNAGVAFAVLLGAFALMPTIQMLFENKEQEPAGTYHGHEKKPLTAAVPLVNVAEKREAREKKSN